MACCSDSNSWRSRTTWPPGSSVRWLSMTRCASSASSGWTDRRTSPRPSTERGKMECGTSELTTDMIPCASSRLRTTRASMADGVRKITTKSGNGRGHLVHFQQDHRHVVVLRRIADKRRDLAQHPFAQLVGRQVRVVLDQLAKTALAEAVVVRVHRLADPVGEEEAEIARVQRDGVLFEQALERFAAVNLESEHEAVGGENPRPPPVDAVRRHVDER